MNIVNTLLNVNFTPGREGHSIKNIVLHTMVGTVSGSDEQFRNPTTQMSAHYGVGLNGDISRWVLEADAAWHADNGPVNLSSIGIQHEDNANPADGVRTDAMYNASAELVADLCQRYGIPCKLVGEDGNHMPVEPGIVLHRQVSLRPTGCPDGLDSDRIIRQTQAILDPPALEPPKPVVYEALPAPRKLRVRNMASGGAELWDLMFRAWADVKSVEHLNAGDEFEAVAIARHPLGGEYYMTALDYNNSSQSDVPFMPRGANVDDLEDYPEEVTAPIPEPQPALAPEPAPAPEITAATEPAPTPIAPQITYSKLTEPLKFVTNKLTHLYDLDLDTFTKITAVKDLAEGTPFVATHKAQVDDDSGITYFVNDQNQGINMDDIEPAPLEPTDQEQTTVTDPPVSENEGSVPVKVTPPDPYKKFNYKDFPDGPKLFHGVGKTDMDDLNPVNPKPHRTLLDKQPIWLQGTFEGEDGESYYRSVKSVVNGDWYAIPINAVTHDNETDHLSSSAIDMSNEEKLNYKQKMLAGIGTTAGLLKWLYFKAYYKTKRG